MNCKRLLYCIVVLLTSAVAAISMARSAVADEIPEEVITVLQQMHKSLAAGEFVTFYREHCDAHIQKQVREQQFAEHMSSDEGRERVALLAEVIEAIRAEALEDTLMARFNPDDETEFELAHVKRRQKHPLKPPPWHIELKLRDGQWRLMDFD